MAGGEFDGYISQTAAGYEVAVAGERIAWGMGLTLAMALSLLRMHAGDRPCWLVTLEGQQTRLVFDEAGA